MSTNTQPPAQSPAHTPTPWRVEVTQATAWIGTPKGDTKLNYIVCGIPAERDLKPEARALALANAAFIVEACNSHATHLARIKVLESALEGVTAWAETMAAVKAHPFLNNSAIVKARAALTPSQEAQLP